MRIAGATQETGSRGPAVREAGRHPCSRVPRQHELPVHDLQRQRGRHREGGDGMTNRFDGCSDFDIEGSL